MLLSGGEKAKIKNIIMAMNGDYPNVANVLGKPKYQKSQKCIDELFACNKRVFMWMAHLPTTLINSNEVLYKSFDLLQESNRSSSINVNDSKKVAALVSSVEMLPTLQAELINMITSDNGMRDKILKDIMDELGIENPNKKKKKDKKFSSMSFDDWFNDD